jgi:hypothetical protein
MICSASFAAAHAFQLANDHAVFGAASRAASLRSISCLIVFSSSCSSWSMMPQRRLVFFPRSVERLRGSRTGGLPDGTSRPMTDADWIEVQITLFLAIAEGKLRTYPSLKQRERRRICSRGGSGLSLTVFKPSISRTKNCVNRPRAGCWRSMMRGDSFLIWRWSA